MRGSLPSFVLQTPFCTACLMAASAATQFLPSSAIFVRTVRRMLWQRHGGCVSPSAFACLCMAASSARFRRAARPAAALRHQPNQETSDRPAAPRRCFSFAGTQPAYFAPSRPSPKQQPNNAARLHRGRLSRPPYAPYFAIVTLSVSAAKRREQLGDRRAVERVGRSPAANGRVFKNWVQNGCLAMRRGYLFF